MKILHITDLHGNKQQLKSIISKTEYDLLVFSGDITHFGHKAEIESVFNIINLQKQPILAVTGNCDYRECKDFLRSQDCLLENKIITIQGVQFIGLEGSLKCPGKTPNEFTEEYYEDYLNKLKKNLDRSSPIILISHQPPHKTKNDRVFMGIHVGSKTIRRFIEHYQPLACLTGHIHEGKGQDIIGECLIINPGPAKDGHFAIIEVIGKNTPVISMY